MAPQPAPVASPPDANESFSDPDEEDEEDEDEEEDGREGVVIYDFNREFITHTTHTHTHTHSGTSLSGDNGNFM